MSDLPFKIISKELLAGEAKPVKRLKNRDGRNLRLEDYIRRVDGQKGVVAEFIGSDTFNQAFKKRQMYEVDAGRDQEPILYTTIYNTVSDPSLPEIMEVFTLGPAGVVLEKITEGGEVKFITVGESSKTIKQIQYGVGLQYTKRMVKFNNLWQMAFIERQVGVAHNALMNHLHLSPILTATYGANNQTAADTTGANLVEKTSKTIQNAIQHAKQQKRRGPYDLVITGGNEVLVKNALLYRLQDSGGATPPGIEQIQNVILYDGWTGARGAKEVSYAGVTAGKAYLASKQYKDQDFQSWESQPLEDVIGQADASRFILEETIWDCFIGTYANPTNAVEEITLPS